ncbi:MAG: hypothetical protein RL011_1553 [Pseudomonadota bacterium]|jgi:hypothetical protein
MGNIQIQTGGYAKPAEVHEFSLIERLLVRGSHPVSMVFYLVSWTWGIFFLWNHQWPLALAMVFVGRVLGHFLVNHADVAAMAETTLGKIAILHAHPFNLVTQFIGAVICLTGVWMHTTETILSGVTFIALGHMAGWAKVNQSLDLHTPTTKS